MCISYKGIFPDFGSIMVEYIVVPDRHIQGIVSLVGGVVDRDLLPEDMVFYIDSGYTYIQMRDEDTWWWFVEMGSGDIRCGSSNRYSSILLAIESGKDIMALGRI